MDWSSGKWVPGPNVFFVVCCNFLLACCLLLPYQQHIKTRGQYFAHMWRYRNLFLMDLSKVIICFHHVAKGFHGGQLTLHCPSYSCVTMWRHSACPYILPPRPIPLSVLIRFPSPLLPYTIDSLLPPFIPARAFWIPLVALSGLPHIPLLLPVRCLHWFRQSLCLPPCPFHVSSILQTSVCPVLLFLPHFKFPCPHLPLSPFT